MHGCLDDERRVTTTGRARLAVRNLDFYTLFLNPFLKPRFPPFPSTRPGRPFLAIFSHLWNPVLTSTRTLTLPALPALLAAGPGRPAHLHVQRRRPGAVPRPEALHLRRRCDPTNPNPHPKPLTLTPNSQPINP